MKIQCPHCHKALSIQNDLPEGRFRCPACSQLLQLPKAQHPETVKPSRHAGKSPAAPPGQITEAVLSDSLPMQAADTIPPTLAGGSEESLVVSLVAQWEQQRRQAKDVSSEELCRECPELLPRVRARIDAIRQGESLLSAAPAIAPDYSAETLAPSAAEMASAPALLVQKVAGYEILGELGRGGMGVVYKARQQGLDRTVALKMILHAEYAGAEDRVRFQREAKVLAGLRHECIVGIYEVGEHNGKPFFSLEYVAGGSLDKRLDGTPLPAKEAARLVQQLTQAMQAAHEAGIVHRDLKPANVLLAVGQAAGLPSSGRRAACPTDGCIPKITDFGLAKKQDEGGLSVSGAVLGTPSYMAPEQAEGRVHAVDARTDVYALGAILYECLTGRPPFRAATAVDTLTQVIGQEPVSIRQLNVSVPRDLETVCLRCLQKDPKRRYPSARELAEDLQRFQEGMPIRARRVKALERGWRWCRRNPAVAASMLIVSVSLLAATVVSLLFGLRAEEARQDAEGARQVEAERARSEATAKQDADQARRKFQRQLIDLSAASGLTAAREGDHSLALLWFARAVQFANNEPDLEELNRIRTANWLRQVFLPEGSFTIPGFRQGQNHFRTFQFSPDGKHLLVVADTGDCLVWDRLRSQLVQLPESAARGSAAAWEPRSGRLAVAAKEGRIQFLAPPNFEMVEEVVASEEIAVLAFSRDGQLLAWGGATGARVWDRAKKEYATPFLVHPLPVASLSFSNSGKLLASSAHDSKARVFRVSQEASEPLFPPVAHAVGNQGYAEFVHGGPEPTAPRFARGDGILITAWDNRDGSDRLLLRSSTTGKFVGSSVAPSGPEHMSAFAISPQGTHVAALWGQNGRLWDLRPRGNRAAIPGIRNWTEDVTFAADGKTLVTGDVDGMVRFWSVDERLSDNLSPSQPSVLHPMQVARVGLSGDGKHLAAALWDGMVCLWRFPEGPPKAYSVPGGWITLPALSPDGRFVLPRGTSYQDGTLLQTGVYEAESGKPAGPKLDLGGIVLDAAFSPDGTKVAISSSTARTNGERKTGDRVFQPDGKAGTVQIWDWKTGKRVGRPIPTPGEPRGLAFRPGGHTLAVVCADYRVLLLDAGTGAITRTLDPGIRTRPWYPNQWWSNGEARFSPDGRFLVTWEMSTHVHVWDPDRGRLLHTLPHPKRVRHVSFHPTTPSLLATSGWDNVARIWDLTSGKLLTPLQHPREVIRLRFSPDGSRLLTSCDDGRLRVWDWKAGKLEDGLLLHPSWLHDFGFTADRRWLVTLGTAELRATDWQTKTPAGPLWDLKSGLQLSLAIPTGDRRVIVGGFGGFLKAYDLKRMVTPAAEPTDDLLRLAELAAGRRILSNGNVVPLSSAEWAERWQRVRRVQYLPASSRGARGLPRGETRQP